MKIKHPIYSLFYFQYKTSFRRGFSIVSFRAFPCSLVCCSGFPVAQVVEAAECMDYNRLWASMQESYKAGSYMENKAQTRWALIKWLQVCFRWGFHMFSSSAMFRWVSTSFRCFGFSVSTIASNHASPALHWCQDADGTVTPHTNQLKAEPVYHARTFVLWSSYDSYVTLWFDFWQSLSCSKFFSIQVWSLWDEPLRSGCRCLGHAREDWWRWRSEHPREDALHRAGWLCCTCHHPRLGVGQEGARLRDLPHHLRYSGWVSCFNRRITTKHIAQWRRSTQNN